jgi:hypothetical protein
VPSAIRTLVGADKISRMSLLSGTELSRPHIDMRRKVVAIATSFRRKPGKNSRSATKDHEDIAFKGLYVVMIPFFNWFFISFVSAEANVQNPFLTVSGRKGGFSCCGQSQYSWC